MASSPSFTSTGRATTGINNAEVGNLLGYRKTISSEFAANEVFASLVAPKYGVKVPPVMVLGMEYGKTTILSAGIEGKSWFQMRDEILDKSEKLPGDERTADAYLKKHAPSLQAFDKAIGNTDRHGGNFVVATDGTVWGIDHEFCHGENHKKARREHAAEWEVACSLTGHKVSAIKFELAGEEEESFDF